MSVSPSRFGGFIEHGAEALLAIAHNAFGFAYSYVKGRYVKTLRLEFHSEAAKIVRGAIPRESGSHFLAHKVYDVGAGTVSPSPVSGMAMRTMPNGNCVPRPILSGGYLDSPATTPGEELIYHVDPVTPTKLVLEGITYYVRSYREIVSDDVNTYLEIVTRSRNPDPFGPIVRLVSLATERPKSTVKIMTGLNGQWMKIAEKSFRAPSTLCLDDPTTTEILQDLVEFLESKAEYDRLGTCFKRSYLLQGEMGGGKSSLIHVMASQAKFDICLVNCTDLTDIDLVLLFSQLPPRVLVCFEDIDVLPGMAIDRQQIIGVNRVSLATLLSLVDGLLSPEGVIFAFTTNHPERVDPALFREGRVDYTVTFRPLTVRQVCDMWELHYPTKMLFSDMVDHVIELGWMSSKLQGAFQRFRGDSVGAYQYIMEQLPIETPSEPVRVSQEATEAFNQCPCGVPGCSGSKRIPLEEEEDE